jgi:hypothetical protein
MSGGILTMKHSSIQMSRVSPIGLCLSFTFVKECVIMWAEHNCGVWQSLGSQSKASYWKKL